jgi:hypothetical protein
MLPKIKPLSLFIGFYLLYSSCYGQQKFEALVLDEHYRPVPGASIVIKGTRGSAATDSKGKISLRIPLHIAYPVDGMSVDSKKVPGMAWEYTPDKDHGLTPVGRAVVRRMLEIGNSMPVV